MVVVTFQESDRFFLHLNDSGICKKVRAASSRNIQIGLFEVAISNTKLGCSCSDVAILRSVLRM